MDGGDSSTRRSTSAYQARSSGDGLRYDRALLRYGFAFIPDMPIADAVRLVRRGEELGYDSAWLPDQTFYSDPFVVLSACALATQRMTLGLGATNPYTRHPVQVARSATTLDELAGGRFTLAFGAGNDHELLRPLGMRQTSAASRCREAVAVTKRLLAGEEVTHESETLIVRGVRLLTPPRPRLMVHMAARSPGTLRAAGDVADGVIIGSLFDADRLRSAIRIFDDARMKRAQPTSVEVTLWGASVLATNDAELEPARLALGQLVGRMQPTGLRTVGVGDDRAHELRQTFVENGPAAVAKTLTRAELDLFSLIGDPEYCRARLREIEQSGVTQFVLLLRSGSADDHLRSITRFMHEVVPRPPPSH
jgi:5,10-methylenetetrahydromethanopterin reductase